MVLGLATAPFGIALLLGPLPSVLGWIENPLHAAVGSIMLMVGSLALLIFFVPESLSIESQQGARSTRRTSKEGQG